MVSTPSYGLTMPMLSSTFIVISVRMQLLVYIPIAHSRLIAEGSLTCAIDRLRCQTNGDFDRHSPASHDSQSPVSGLHEQGSGTATLLT